MLMMSTKTRLTARIPRTFELRRADPTSLYHDPSRPLDIVGERREFIARAADAESAAAELALLLGIPRGDVTIDFPRFDEVPRK